MINIEAPIQNLEFEQLKFYYKMKNLELNEKTYIDNLRLKTPDGKFNYLAYVLADNGNIPIRVAIFSGTDKSDKLYSIEECGNRSILHMVNEVIKYGKTLNFTKARENIDEGFREDYRLFDQECFNEAVKNAFIHNRWIIGGSPMITFYTDRVEIVSFGKLPPSQTIKQFYEGISVPVNEELAKVFLQTRISEQSGKGVREIVNKLGKKAFTFYEEAIKVTIPFNWINTNFIATSVNIKREGLSDKDNVVLNEIIKKPNITINKLSKVLKISTKAVRVSIDKLKKLGLIEREGSYKTGYWKVTK